MPRYQSLPASQVVSVRLLPNELASLDGLVGWLRSAEFDERAVRSDALLYALEVTARRAKVWVNDDVNDGGGSS